MAVSQHSIAASPATRAATAPPSLPATHHPRRFVDPAELGSVADQPTDPARVNPLHLPALAHVAADLDGLNAPIRLVPATDLAGCVDCGSHGDGALPVQPSIAVVVAVDAYGFRIFLPACALHVGPLVAWQTRRECAVAVEVPADGRRWFDWSPRETWYAVDDETGVVVARDVCDSWTVYLFHANYAPIPLVARMGLRDGESYSVLRMRAEVLAQAYAASVAAGMYEAAQQDAVTVGLPVVANGVAA